MVCASRAVRAGPACSAVQGSAGQCSAVQCIELEFGEGGERHLFNSQHVRFLPQALECPCFFPSFIVARRREYQEKSGQANAFLIHSFIYLLISFRNVHCAAVFVAVCCLFYDTRTLWRVHLVLYGLTLRM